MAVENKTEIVPVRLAPSQKEKFREAAEAQGFRLSDWLRRLAEREMSRASA